MSPRWFLLTVFMALPAVSSAAKDGGTTACDFAGSYRFRFLSNGHDGWWFRFKVEGTPPKATLVEDVEVLALKTGRLDMVADPTRCKFVLHAKGHAVGQIAIAIALDAAAGSFKGTLTRTEAVEATERKVAISGFRDLADPHPSNACVRPGVYRIDFDPKARWKNADKGDKRSCKRSEDWAQPVFVRVEPFGKALAIGKVKAEPPYGEVWASDSTELHGDCDVAATISDDELDLKVKLTFAGDRVTGTAVEANQQVFEDDGNIWNCVTRNASLLVTPVR